MAEPASSSAPEVPAPLAAVPPTAEAHAEPWSPAKRAAFRFAFCLALLLYFPFPFGFLPFTNWAAEPLGKAQVHAFIWLSERVFHVPEEELPDATGSGDTFYGYTERGAKLVFALVAAAVWTALDRRRAQYRRLGAWLNVGLRWALFSVMLSYGVSKVMPLQMPWDEARLVEPFGEFSPMGLVWTFMATSAPYQMFSGWGEVIGGTLLVWRRTAGLGAFVLLAVLGNVVAVNFCFDVPVKLYSSQLWLTAAFLAAPDARRLFRLLVLRRPTEPGEDVPLVRWERVRRRRWLSPALIVGLAGWPIFENVRDNLEWRGQLQEMGEKAPFRGPYQVESFTPASTAKPESALAAPAWARISAAPFRVGVLRADGSYFSMRVEAAEDGTLTISRRGAKEPGVIHLERPDAEHLRLTGDNGFEVKLKIIPSSSYMILRDFHWVQPVPVNR